MARKRNRAEGRTFKSRARASDGTPVLPGVLEKLVYAARMQGEHDRADALTALGELALMAVPAYGVFAPADDADIWTAIDRVAASHLQLGECRKGRRAAMESVASLEQRDAIEAAQNECQ